MKPDEIHLTDWHRLLVGQAPWAFLVEVLARAVVTYVILLVAMRLMGKRVAGQMSALELTIVVTLGAAIGVPLQAPDRGMVPAVVILLVAVVYQRGLNFWAFKSRKAELAFQGDVSLIVKEGCLDLGEMCAAVLSRERLFSVLREQGLVHLGQVKRRVPGGGRPLQHLPAGRPAAGAEPHPGGGRGVVRGAVPRARPPRVPQLRRRRPRRRLGAKPAAPAAASSPGRRPCGARA